MSAQPASSHPELPAGAAGVSWQVLRQGLPLAVGLASHALFNLVDLILVGRLGGAAVAGAHVATVVNFLPMVLGNGVSVASLAKISLLVGGGRLDEARALSSRTQRLMIWLGLACGVLGVATAGPCVSLQGLSGDARSIGVHYLVVSQLGCVTMFALMQTTVSMRAVGEGWAALWLLIGTNLLNLGLAWILIFGWEEIAMPKFGAPGAAYATVIARGVGAVAGFLWLAREAHPLRFSLHPAPGPNGERLGLILTGLPQSCQMLVRASLVIMMTRLASDLAGEAAVTALGVTTRFDTVVLFGASGFASAATALCAQSLGAGEPGRARQIARVAACAAFTFALLVVTVFAFSAPVLLRLFVSKAEHAVVAAGIEYLQVALVAQPLAAVAIACTGAINGGGRTVPPLLLDAAVYALLLAPVVIAYAARAGATLWGLWWWLAAANLVLALLYVIYSERGGWARASKFC